MNITELLKAKINDNKYLSYTLKPFQKEILILDFNPSIFCKLFKTNLERIAEDNNIELVIRHFNSRFLFVNDIRIEFINYSNIDNCREKKLDYIYRGF